MKYERKSSFKDLLSLGSGRTKLPENRKNEIKKILTLINVPAIFKITGLGGEDKFCGKISFKIIFILLD